ncbi:putative MFS multidrug transporter [Talaromyces proteolyticus]|uniref:MFS multidrug transporter n=1 Tax=Talaromyces proteolyticus TaxID=1131652 RepID=A0AAD4KLZ9_9EURO|nr:putative MFS multidrug transporter [Talaromyces proteolyticus]KAH8694219.1 putative MFS multidrug transporter [Talaromyces proteolyticus]
MDSRQFPPTEATPLLAADAGEIRESAAVVERDPENPALSPLRAIIVGIAISISMLIQATNMTMVTTSQSDIAADLDAFSSATWLTASFMIAVASISPLGGRFCQIFSLRSLILASNLVAGIGLFFTASARTLPMFLFGRVLTGCGGAGIYSTQAILVLELASKKRRGLFLGLTACVFTTGIAGGAVLAGAVTPKYGWRLIYYIQSPLALIVGPIIYLGIPPKPRAKDSSPGQSSFTSKLARLDYLGIVTLTTANLLFLYSVSSNTIPYPPILVSGILFVLFLWIESSPALTAEPIIPISILRSRGVLLTCLCSTGMMMARWAIVFYIPVYGIAVRGWSPAKAGMILIPTNLGFGLGGLTVGWFHIRKVTSYYTSCLIILTLFVTSFLSIAQLSTSDSPVILFALAVFYNGFCAGALLNYTLSHVLHLTLPSTHFIVTSLIATFRSFAGSFGAAVGGGIFSRVLKSQLDAGFLNSREDYQHFDHNSDDVEDLIRRLLGSPALVWQLNGNEKTIAIGAYQSALKATFLAACGLVALVTFLQAGTGWTAPVDSMTEVGQDVDEGAEDESIIRE